MEVLFLQGACYELRRPLIFSTRINLCEWVLCRLIFHCSMTFHTSFCWIQFLKRRWWLRWRHNNEAIEKEHFISSIEHSFNPWVICHHLKLFQPLMRCTFIPKWFFELNEHHCDANCMWEWTEIRELRSLCATLSFGQPNKCNYVFCNHFHCHRFARMLLKVPQTRKWIFGLNVWKYSHLNVRTKLHDKWLQTIFTIFSSTSIFVSLEQILIEGNVLHFQNDINS